MTEAELREAAETFGKIRSLREDLQRSQERLDLINAHVKKGESWEVNLTLVKGDHYNRALTMYVRLPVEVVQQQAVNEVSALRRKIIHLGGTP